MLRHPLVSTIYCVFVLACVACDGRGSNEVERDAGQPDGGANMDGAMPDAASDSDAQDAGPRTATAEDFLGDWAGVISIPGGVEFRILLRISNDDDGDFVVILDSPDQGAYGVVGRDPRIEGARFKVLFPPLGASMDLERKAWDLIGVFNQGASQPVTLMRVTIPPLVRPQEEGLRRDYGTELLTFPGGADGVTLAGELTRPQDSDRFPAVVLVSLSEASDRDMTVAEHRPMLVLAEHLTHAGIATLRYDNRGVGQSSGDADTATPEDYAADAAAALAFLRGQAGVDAAQTGFIGHTDGGLSAVLAGGDPAFLVLLGMPSQPVVEVLMRRSRDLERQAGTPDDVLDAQAMLQMQLFAAVREAADVEEAQSKVVNLLVNAGLGFGPASEQAEILTRPWLRWIMDYDPLPAVRSVEAPVLALYGEKSLIVAADENAPDMAAALTHPSSSMRVLAGLNHFFQPAMYGGPGEYVDIETTFDPDAMGAISAFITGVLAPDALPNDDDAGM